MKKDSRESAGHFRLVAFLRLECVARVQHQNLASRVLTFTQFCYNAAMNQTYTAIIKQDRNWWIGWIEEVPGVNCQENSREVLLTSLRETLIEALEFNRSEAIDAAGKGFEELSISV